MPGPEQILVTDLKIDPAKTAFTFGGQGTQYVGMAKDLYIAVPSAAAVINQADNFYGTRVNLKKLMFEGPEEELTETDNTQRAIVTAGRAYTRVLRGYLGTPAFLFGHSVGNYTALIEAGAVDDATGYGIVDVRGEAMDYASKPPFEASGMLAVVRLDVAKKRRLTKSIGQVEDLGDAAIAAANAPDQLTLSLALKYMDGAKAWIKGDLEANSVALKVGGGFHHPVHMAPAGERLEEYLREVRFNEISGNVLANTNTKPLYTPRQILAECKKQMIRPVMYEGSVREAVKLGVEHFVDVGPRKVLSGLNPSILGSEKPVEIVDPNGIVIATYTRLPQAV